MRTARQSGFSLLELAISLAILAILAGGTLKGRELIRSARIQSTITEINTLETAITAFESRYSGLPGDFPAATAAGLGTAGNGNYLLDTDAEVGSFWRHLGESGFISGNYDGAEVTGFECPATTCRKSPLGGTFKVSSDLTMPNVAEGKLAVSFGQDQPANLLAELDRKMDDGRATSGQLRVLTDWAELCSTENGLWDEAQNPECQAAYLLR